MSSEQPVVPSVPPRQSHHLVRRFLGDLFVLPLLHKSILLIAVVLIAVGWFHLGVHAATDSGGATATTQASSGGGIVSPEIQALGAGLARKYGSSVVIGYVAGWLFREFLKVTAIVTTLIVGLLSTLSYFHIMNVNFTEAEQKYSTASAWVIGQAGKLRDSALAHVHSTTGGAAGVVLGMRKRMIV
jgi:uncharacterized membrane protein (Fun14 family)